jgi:hypothetical protein
MAFVLVASSMLALNATADAARKSKRIARAHHYYYKAHPRYSARERLECERAQQEDPTGLYAAYPCWARETFGRGSRAWN